jgi:ABC-type glycerol-3-phosphate transport system substrate-binding protein
MKKNICLLILVTIIMVMATGCRSNRNKEKNEDWNIENLNLYKASSDDSFILNSENVKFFTLSNEGMIYAVTENKPLAKFNSNGDFLEEYENVGNISNIYLSDDILYAFDLDENRIVAYDFENKTKTAISDVFNFEISEVNNLIFIDGKILVFLVPAFNHVEHECEEEHGCMYLGAPDENNYLSFNEKLYVVNLSNGRIKDLNIPNIISIYKNTSEDVYYYAYKEENYELHRLDINTGQSQKIADMNDVGYAYAFIYEGINFIYIDINYRLRNKDIFKNEIITINSDFFVSLGSNIWLYSGHLVYQDIISFGTIENPRRNSIVSSIYIGHLFNDKIQANGVNESNVLTLSATSPHYSVIDSIHMKAATGIDVLIIDQPVESIEFFTQIMANNNDVDIYILSANDYLIQRLIEINYYVPLNSSKTIHSYIDGCFDYISEFSKNDNGDIWGVPLSVDSLALIYVPENFSRFGLSVEDVKYFDNYIATLEIFQNAGSGYYVYGNNAEIFFWDCYKQYEFTYNNYENNYVNFKTELFKNIFTTLFDGYMTFEGQSHSLFKSVYSETFYNMDGNLVYSAYIPDNVIFKHDWISNFLNPWSGLGLSTDIYSEAYYFIGDWRAFPTPRISENVNKNKVNIYFALINPNSNNIEKAIIYLEEFVRNPHNLIQQHHQNFTQKDLSFYEETYDTSLSVFNDIYDIIKNGFLLVNPSPNISNLFIDDYQRGRMTISEITDVLQREYEMALNE